MGSPNKTFFSGGGGGGVGHFPEQHNGKLNNERLHGLPHMVKTQELFHSQAHQTLKNID